VGSVAVSPDGSLVAAEGHVWDRVTGQEISRFKKIRGGMVAVAFSADGRTLLSAQPNGATQHWDIATGQLIRENVGSDPRSGGDFFAKAEFSPDGKILALADSGGHNALLVEVATGKRLLQIKKDKAIFSVAVSHDGKILATGGLEDTIRLWEIATGKQISELKGHGYGVEYVQFSPDDRILAAVTGKDLQLWDLATSKEIRRIVDSCVGPTHSRFSPDGKTIAVAKNDIIYLWDVSTGKMVRRFIGHGSWLIPGLRFSADGKILASGGTDHTVQIWEVATGKRLGHFQGHQGAVISLAFSPDGRNLASGGDEDHTLIVWDLASCRPRHSFTTNQYGWILCIAYSPDGKIIAMGDGINGKDDREHQIRLWDATDGRVQREFFGHLAGVQSLAFSPDGKTLVSSGGDDRVRFWDPSTGKRLRQVRGPAGRTLRFAADGKTLFDAGTLTLWSADMGVKLRDFRAGENEHRRIIKAVFAEGAKLILTLEIVRESPARRPITVTQLAVWDSESGRRLRSVALSIPELEMRNEVNAFSPDGKLLAIGDFSSQPPAIGLWDTESGKLLTKLRGHTGRVASLTFSPDGKTLASGSWDTTVLLWDITRAQLIGLWQQLARESDAAAEGAKRLSSNPPGAVSLLKECMQRAADQEAPYARLISDLDNDRFQVRARATDQLKNSAAAAEFALQLALNGTLSPEARQRAQQIIDMLTARRQEEIVRLFPDLEGAKSREALQQLEAMGPTAELALRQILKWPPMARRDAKDYLPRRARRFLQQALERLEKAEIGSLPITPESVPRALSVLAQIGTPEARQALQELAKGPAEGLVTQKAKDALAQLATPARKP
jgi:WD40 repeat protein